MYNKAKYENIKAPLVIAMSMILIATMLTGCDKTPYLQEDSLEVVALNSRGEEDNGGDPFKSADILVRNTGDEAVYSIEVETTLLNEEGISVQTEKAEFEGVLLPGQTGLLDLYVWNNDTDYEKADKIVLSGSYSFKKASDEGSVMNVKRKGKFNTVPDAIDFSEADSVEATETKACENSELDGDIKLSDEEGIAVDSMAVNGEGYLEVELSNTSDKDIQMGSLKIGCLDESGNIVRTTHCASKDQKEEDSDGAEMYGLLTVKTGETVKMTSVESVTETDGYDYSHATAIGYSSESDDHILSTIPKAIAIY